MLFNSIFATCFLASLVTARAVGQDLQERDITLHIKIEDYPSQSSLHTYPSPLLPDSYPEEYLYTENHTWFEKKKRDGIYRTGATPYVFKLLFGNAKSYKKTLDDATFTNQGRLLATFYGDYGSQWEMRSPYSGPNKGPNNHGCLTAFNYDTYSEFSWLYQFTYPPYSSNNEKFMTNVEYKKYVDGLPEPSLPRPPLPCDPRDPRCRYSSQGDDL